MPHPTLIQGTVETGQEKSPTGTGHQPFESSDAKMGNAPPPPPKQKQTLKISQNTMKEYST